MRAFANKVVNMKRRRTRDAILSPADIAASKRLRAAWDARARERGLTQDKMAELLGGTQGLVSHYLNQRAALNYRVLMTFAKALDVEPTDIRDDLPEQAFAPATIGTDWLPALGFAQAVGLGVGIEANEYAESHGLMFRKSFYTKIGATPEECRVFYGKGDSMFPTIQDGDAFLFVTSQTALRKGNLYLLHIDGPANKEYNVKRCVGGGLFAADNPDGDHDWKEPRALGSNDVVLGRVRWVGRMVK